ncbi:MAG: hypothetical protein NVS2B12_19590 [Ktedonobacteraceae bacterium]
MVTQQQEAIARWLQLISLAASCYNVGTIWMTQLGYRLWARIKPGEFEEYHRAWWEGWGGIKPIVFPAGIAATLGSLAQLRWRSAAVPRWLLWLNIMVQVQSWLWTGLLWAPLQARLKRTQREDGGLDPDYQRLMSTHWWRVALFTASGVLQFCIVVMSFLTHD